MSIKVIEQTTEERKQETINLFNQIKPLLDEGYTYNKALSKIGRIPNGKLASSYSSHGWYRDLREYGEQQGYLFKEYSGCGKK